MDSTTKAKGHSLKKQIMKGKKMLPNYQQNPFLQRVTQVEQPFMPYGQQGQFMQTIQPAQPAVQCFNVSKKADMENMQIQPNTIHIGVNESSKEVYLRRWNNNGLIEFEKYQKQTEEEKKPETAGVRMEEVLQKLNSIEERLFQRKQPERKGEMKNE